MLHFPDDSQSQHKSSYKRRSNGALFVVLGVFLGMYANDNLTNSLKDIQKTFISKSVSIFIMIKINRYYLTTPSTYLVWSVLSFRFTITSSFDEPDLWISKAGNGHMTCPWDMNFAFAVVSIVSFTICLEATPRI